jgi:hypothetical protein
VYKTRTRMVSFRLSEDEYERLKDMSLMECARSVSEFARSTLCRLPGAANDSAESAGPRMERLEGALRQLRLDMNQLRQLVESSLEPVSLRAEAASLQENNQ